MLYIVASASINWRKGKERRTKAADDSHPTECDSRLVNSLIPIIVVTMITMMMAEVMMMNLRAASGWNHNAWQWQKGRQAATCVTGEVCFQIYDSSSSWIVRTDEILIRSLCSEHRSLSAVVMSTFIYVRKNIKKDPHKMNVYFIRPRRCFSQPSCRITEGE